MNWTMIFYMMVATVSWLQAAVTARHASALRAVRVRAGQGVVEYAGALVIAAVLIATALITLQPASYTFFNNLQNQILTYLNGQITSLGG